MSGSQHFRPSELVDFQRALQQPGRRLSPRLQAELELIFDMKLDALRVQENHAATLLGVRAFACGETISISPEFLNWKTTEGLMLIGHELGHVKQQRSMGRSAEMGIVADPSMEADADAWGERLAQSLSPRMTWHFDNCCGANQLTNVLQCMTPAWALAKGVASTAGSWASWAWNQVPAIRSQTTTQDQLNQQNIQSTMSGIETQTALKKQGGSDSPIFVPQPAKLEPDTPEQMAVAISKMTLAENMARQTPLQLMLRNSLLGRSATPQLLPPTAAALSKAQLEPTQPNTRPIFGDARGVMPGSLGQGNLRSTVPDARPTFGDARGVMPGSLGQSNLRVTAPDARPSFGDARGVMPGALGQATLRHVDTKVTAGLPGAQEDYKKASEEKALEKKKLEFFTRLSALKIKTNTIRGVLTDPAIQVLQTAVNDAYIVKPEPDYDVLLNRLGTLEARVKESFELTDLLARKTADKFFNKYFDDEISTWGELPVKLDERVDSTDSSSARLCPVAYARWEAIFAAYGATPRDKSQIMLRLGELVQDLDREATILNFGKIKKYRTGYRRQVGTDTGSWECEITITENAWNTIETSGGNPEQIKGILTQNPVPIQKDGTTKGVRAIKPEPYGWIFSTSAGLRLVSKFPAKDAKATKDQKPTLDWPPTKLNFDGTHQAVH